MLLKVEKEKVKIPEDTLQPTILLSTKQNIQLYIDLAI